MRATGSIRIGTLISMLAISIAGCEVISSTSANEAPSRQVAAHEDPIWSVAFTPDGDRIATASSDGTIRIWDLATGGLVQSLEAHSSWVLDIDFSHDGQILVSGSIDGSVKVWSVATWTEIAKLAGHLDSVSDVVVMPSGRAVASASYDMSVTIWDIDTGEKQDEYTFDAKYINAVAVDPAGNYLAVALAGDGPESIRTELIDLRSRERIGTFGGHEPFAVALSKWASDERSREIAEDALQAGFLYGGVTDVQFTPNGHSIVTVGADGKLIVHSIADRQEILNIQAHEASITALAISPDGFLAATTADDMLVRVRDLADGSLRYQFGPFAALAVEAVAFSPDGSLLATGSHDGQLRIWEISK